MLMSNKYDYKGYEIHEDKVGDRLRFFIHHKFGTIECSSLEEMQIVVEQLLENNLPPIKNDKNNTC